MDFEQSQRCKIDPDTGKIRITMNHFGPDIARTRDFFFEATPLYKHLLVCKGSTELISYLAMRLDGVIWVPTISTLRDLMIGADRVRTLMGKDNIYYGFY